MKKIALMLSLVGLAASLSACGSDSKDNPCNAEFKDGCYNGVYLQCVFNGSEGNVVEKAFFEYNRVSYVCDPATDELVPRDMSCDGNKLNYNGESLDYVCDGRANGKVYVCRDGNLTQQDTVEANGSTMVCNSDLDLVPADYKCEDGMLVKDGAATAAICDPLGSDSLFVCNDSNQIVKSDSVVASDGVSYVCREGFLVPDGYRCEDGKLVNGDVAVPAFCSAFDPNIIFGCDNGQVVSGSQLCGDMGRMECQDGAVHAEPCSDGLTCLNYERDNKFFATCIKDSDVVVEGCEEGITASGKCENDGTLVFCTRNDSSKGKTLKINCPAMNQACMFINDKWGYDCSAQCSGPNGEIYNEHGLCLNNTLYYCGIDEAAGETVSSYHTLECSGMSKTCGFDFDKGHQYDCL